MNNWLRIPGFPPPEKQDVVQFHLLKSLSYSPRLILYLALILIGFSLQLVMMTVWPGAVLLIFATMLNLVRGYDTRTSLPTFNVDANWTAVDMDRIHEVEKLDDRITRWNQDGLDISNVIGIASFLGATGVIVIIAFLLGGLSNQGDMFSIDAFISQGTVFAIFLTNAVILILPFWFNGIRRILKQDNLRVKTGIIISMEEHFNKIREEGEHFNPALMLLRTEEGKSIPSNARFTISFADMPPDFYGIMGQININVVQGSSYPYFYCVIPAKTGFGLKAYADGISRETNIAVEFQNNPDAEVIVIRQATTNKSGYSTNLSVSKTILEMTLQAARVILKEEPQVKTPG